MASPALIRLRGVGKTFSNGVKALKGLDLEVREGEFVSLLGPSGCGKSTALRMIAGLGQPSEGDITWEREEARRGLGFVFQEPTLMPWARAFENVYLPLKLKGVPRNEAREPVMSALEHVGLKGFEQAYPRALSGGMKMRVSIARALVTGPSLLLMDEPFAALDEITRFRLNADVLDLWQRRGLTALFVTHSVFESVFLSTRIVVMGDRPGRVVAEIPVDAPYPRTEEFRTGAQYGEICREVSAALKAAMADRPADGVAA